MTPRTTSTRTRRVFGSTAVLLELWERCTDRDRWVLRMLSEHRVLTTPQLTAAAFSSARVTRARLQMLANFGAILGLRPRGGPGSKPLHWAVDENGVRLLAADDGVEFGALRWRREHALNALAAGTMRHTVGANGIGIGLIAHARTCRDCRLVAWWGERRTAEAIGDRIRPDGYLRWAEDGREVEVLVEYDTGTEPHEILLGKTDKYAALAEHTGLDLPALFVFPSSTREAGYRRLAAGVGVSIATTTLLHLAAEGSAAGPVWQPLHRTGPRQHLIDLAASPPGGGAGPYPVHTQEMVAAGRPAVGQLAGLGEGRAAPDPSPPPVRGWTE